MKYRLLIYMIFLLQVVIVSGQVSECPIGLDIVLSTANEICIGTGRNQVCYGNNDVNLTSYDETQIEFNSPGDLANLNKIRALSLSALDVDTNQWGIAVMRLLANLDPSQAEDVTVLLFGDVALEDASNNPNELIITATTYSNLRRLPDSRTPVMDSVAPDDIIHLTGRLADNSWVRVVNPKTNIAGWMASSLLNDIDFEALDIVDARQPYFAPMQAFYYQSGTDSIDCTSVPRDGMIVQTPEGLRRVTLWINEVTIDFLSNTGATASIQTEADGSMSINVLEGSAYVGSDTEGYLAVAGSSVNVRPSVDGKPVSISKPTSTDMEIINGIPIDLLDHEIVLPAPASDEQIAEANGFVDETPITATISDGESGTTTSSENGEQNTVNAGGSSADGCNGNSCNAPGQNNNGCNGNSCNAPGHNKDKKDKKNK